MIWSERGIDIDMECRLNWDENKNPPLPFYAASSGYTPGAVLALVQKRIEWHRERIAELDRWYEQYRLLPSNARHDWVTRQEVRKK